MEIRISYRPFTQVLNAYNTVDDTLSDEAREVTYDKDDDDQFFVSVGTLNGEFHNLFAMDCVGRGHEWVKMVKGLLPEETIATLVGYMNEWQTAYDDKWHGNMKSGEAILVRHQAVLTV